MKKNIFVYILLCLFLLSSPLLAKHKKPNNLKAKDPISWTISPSSGFPSQTTKGNIYTVTYTLTNNLPFAVPLSVSDAFNGGKFSLTNGCNTTLQPNGTCQVTLSLQPE